MSEYSLIPAPKVFRILRLLMNYLTILLIYGIV
nr:MAG TPA: hypothetical protein [Caudoviricetes sp.]